MKKYEAVFILDIRKSEDEGAAFTREFEELIVSLGGKLESTTPMGRRQFTYEIDKRRAGLYFDFVFELAPAAVKEIKERYKLDQRILRNMILICADFPADRTCVSFASQSAAASRTAAVRRSKIPVSLMLSSGDALQPTANSFLPKAPRSWSKVVFNSISGKTATAADSVSVCASSPSRSSL